MPEVLSAVKILSDFLKRFSTIRVNGKMHLICSRFLHPWVLSFSSFTDLVILNYGPFFFNYKKKNKPVKATVTKNSANLRPPSNLCYGSYNVLKGKLYYLTEQYNTSLRCIIRQQTLLQ